MEIVPEGQENISPSTLYFEQLIAVGKLMGFTAGYLATQRTYDHHVNNALALAVGYSELLLPILERKLEPSELNYLKIVFEGVHQATEWMSRIRSLQELQVIESGEKPLLNVPNPDPKDPLTS